MLLTWLNQVTRLVVDLNGCGDFSITILAHKVPEPWVSHWPNSSISPSPAFILIFEPTILAHKVPESWVSHRTGDWLNASDSLSQDRWNSDYYERLETSYCLVLKKEFIDDVYTVPVEISCLYD